MEENSEMKIEQFAWNDGRRIVDLCELSRQMLCKQCSSLLDLRRTEKETRFGLASVLFIVCNCGVVNEVHTGKLLYGEQRNPGPVYEVNTKASVNLLMYGSDTSCILSFLALLDIPLPDPHDPALTLPVKDGMADSLQSRSHRLPSDARPSYTTPAASFSADVSGTSCSLSASLSSSACGPDSSVNSVPLALPSHQYWERENGGDREDSGNVCDKSDGGSSVADEDVKRINDAVFDNSKTDDDLREHTQAYAMSSRSLLENEEKGDEKDDYVPPLKIRTKAHNPHTMRNSSAKRSRKTPAATRQLLKVVFEKAPRTNSAQAGNVSLPADSAEEQESENEAEDNEVDYSNTMEWSSTESEPEVEASQDGDGDASGHGEEEKEQPAKPKRGRGRPRGSANKVERPGKRGTGTKNTSLTQEESRTEDMEASSAHRCTICGKGFNSARGYNLHVTRMHSQEDVHQDQGSHQERRNEEGPDEESHSEIRDSSEGLLPVMQEEDVVAELFLCLRCSSAFANAKNFFFHTNKTHPTLDIEEKEKLYRVSLKDSIRKRRVVYADGMETISYQCCKCCHVFPSPSALANHLCIDSDGQLSCVGLCPQGTRIDAREMELVLRHKLPCQCNICGKEFSDQGVLKKHIRVVHTEKTFSCGVCGVSCSRPSSLQTHMETHDANRPRPFGCQFCEKRFFNRKDLRKHERHVHLTSKQFLCPVCGKEFASRGTRASHMVLHTGHRAYSCSVCSMTFYKKYNLTVHERIHSGFKPYTCPICQVSFSQKKSLEMHTKKHEQGSLCNVCGKEYASQEVLKKHIKDAHSEKKMFPCSDCGMTFSRLSNLQAHAETHNVNRPRPFVCQFCGKRFFTKKDLRTHERNQHLSSAPFLCTACGKEFSTRRVRDSHMVIHSGQRVYSCSHCSMNFYKKYNLTVHERIHSGVKPYTCSVCQKAFAQKNSLNVHMKKHGEGLVKDSTDPEAAFEADLAGVSPETAAHYDERHSDGDMNLRKET
ncbi:hypothetical protein ACOMHN_028709 [Nucella lapillus]